MNHGTLLPGARTGPLSDISVCMQRCFLSERLQARHSALLYHPPITPTSRVIVNEPVKTGEADHQQTTVQPLQ